MGGTAIVLETDPDALRAVAQAVRTLSLDIVPAFDVASLVRAAAAAKGGAIIFASEQPPPHDAMTLLRELGKVTKDSAIVVTTKAAPNKVQAFEPMRLGAVDVLARPFDEEAVAAALGRAVRIGASHQRLKRYARTTPTPVPPARRTPLPPALDKALSALDTGEMTIPAVPELLRETRNALADPKKSITDLARLIERDQSLAANVMRVSNTTEFARGNRVTDLHTAVARIGLRRVQGFVETIILKNCFQPRTPELVATASEIWRHAVALGLSMRALAERLSPMHGIDANAAYVAGLLCDVGASWLVWLVDTHAPSLSPDVWMPLLRDRHESVATRVLTEWGLGPHMVQLGGMHHAVNRPTGSSMLWPLCAVGMEMAQMALRCQDLTRRIDWNTTSAARCADVLQIDAPTIRNADEQMRRELEAILGALG